LRASTIGSLVAIAAGLLFAAVALPQESLLGGECLVGGDVSCEGLLGFECLVGSGSCEYLVASAGGGGGAGGACAIKADRLITPTTAGANDNYIDLVLHTTATTESGQLSLLTPKELTVSNLMVRILTAPGTGDKWRIILRDDGVSTGVTCDISGTELTCADTENTAVIAAGSALTFLVESDAGSTDPTASGHMTLAFCTDDS
jgi:hypothetical protein